MITRSTLHFTLQQIHPKSLYRKHSYISETVNKRTSQLSDTYPVRQFEKKKRKENRDLFSCSGFCFVVGDTDSPSSCKNKKIKGRDKQTNKYKKKKK